VKFSSCYFYDLGIRSFVCGPHEMAVRFETAKRMGDLAVKRKVSRFCRWCRQQARNSGRRAA
jgi:hypothetical protein